MWGKTIAGIFIITGAFGFGRALCQDMNCTLKHLKEQKHMLIYMINEISFLHKPMQEVFESIEEKINEPYKKFINSVLNTMYKGSGAKLEDVWENEIKRMLKESLYPKLAIDYLYRFKRCFRGDKDRLQVEQLRLLEAELEEEIKTLVKEKDEKGRLIQTLSILAGVFCVIVLM